MTCMVFRKPLIVALSNPAVNWSSISSRSRFSSANSTSIAPSWCQYSEYGQLIKSSRHSMTYLAKRMVYEGLEPPRNRHSNYAWTDVCPQPERERKRNGVQQAVDWQL